jgi:hypothetical protein
LTFICKREKEPDREARPGKDWPGLGYPAADDPRRRSAANGGGTLDANGALQHCLLTQFDMFAHPVELPGATGHRCRADYRCHSSRCRDDLRN